MVNVVETAEMRGTGEPFPVTAPLLGLNTRDDFTTLKPTEARVLENWLPDGGSCRVRPGHDQHQEISGASLVPTLVQFKGASDRQLIAAAGGEVYDVTGTPNELSGSAGYTVDRWSTANFNGYLFAVNGADTPWRYDGSTLGATGFTGPTLTNLQTVSVVRNRLWFTQVASADVRYGGIGAVTGALTTFQLSQIASGGKCIAIGSWSRDAGDGSDDFTVFVMNTGEVIVYQGDPAKSFRLEGKYMAPAPVAVDGVVKVGGELVIMTRSGLIPVTAILASNPGDPSTLNAQAIGVWGKIAPSWAKDVKRYVNNAGWNAHFFDGLVYFVVPTGVTATKIHVLNTRNPAWTLYTKLPAAQFADLDGTLYFGSYSDANVYRHATGTDNGGQIVTLARQGWSYPGGGNRSNQYTMMRPNINASASCEAQFGLDVDFRESQLAAPAVTLSAEAEGGAWDEADWDEEDWASDPVPQRRWYPAIGRGRAVAPVVRTFSTADEVEWFSTDVIAKPGGIF